MYRNLHRCPASGRFGHGAAYVHPVRTVGVDLAAEARATAVAVVTWRDDGTANVCDLTRWEGDAAVVDAVAYADRAAIDCPLGGPSTFDSFLAGHSAGQARPRALSVVAARMTTDGR